jgi:hypothetical protein
VGSNIATKTSFDGLFNSKNIKSAYGKKPELLVYSGVRGTKFLANSDPETDYLNIKDAMKNIMAIEPKKLVLISTVDVFKNPSNVNEDSPIETKGLHAYGLHRLELEKWVEKNILNYSIIRIPALYGINLKKNFIYDLINIIPPMLSQKKIKEITKDDNFILYFFSKQKDGFFHCRELQPKEKTELKQFFNSINFTALNFTDSRATYQFYNLTFLWDHIEIAVKNSIKLLHIATEPVSAGELYEYINKKEFNNEISERPVQYDYRTKYEAAFGGSGGYIKNKSFVLKDIKNFVEAGAFIF